ncbi:GlcG/HbpS family heme-binding protein [Streptomyces shenzhenensis]|uniref:GlcG/HbpS family heme-binding protein n=1 Tax=Streptomyces shenzhenensis TaxID=943815 RepID=UPI0015F0B291|nr:heme-binding protein [Streptomyces shenzhenensis]
MREPLSYEIARRAAEAVLDAARAEGARVSVAVVNRSGITKVILADDGAGPIAVETSRLKAYTSAVMGVSTADFAEMAAEPVMKQCPPHLVDRQLHPVPGGYPIITDDGEVIGGMGVGGAHGGVDARIASEGLKSIAGLLT